MKKTSKIQILKFERFAESLVAPFKYVTKHQFSCPLKIGPELQIVWGASKPRPISFKNFHSTTDIQCQVSQPITCGNFKKILTLHPTSRAAVIALV
jgi:hypothetical protein